jgi:ATP-binding cassette subfamily B multidrug efflux pump
LKNSPILILDEATSALDRESEAIVQENLYEAMAGRTVLAIAHRASTLVSMDRIVLLDDQQIVEVHRNELFKSKRPG